MLIRILGFALIVLAIIIMVANYYGINHWQSDTRKLLAKMKKTHIPITPTVYTSRELEGLPAPVQRYFRTALKEGQPFVAGINIEHTGTFNMSETGEQWKPFKSTQHVSPQHPGFIWDARIFMAPGMTVFVHDAYVGGQGVLTARLLGLFTVMTQPSTPELAQGELMRFFAEGAWYPTALLPSQGVVWEAIDDTRANAILSDGTTQVTLVFHFDDQGLINTVYSNGRYRIVDGEQVATPWQGRFWDYEMRDGMLIPLSGEVAWLLPDGLKPYWRGRIQRIQYEMCQ